ncbi:serine hydrolase domain-containing protein [Pseudothioclava arenosa]|uniref:6-aminohexanoate hydrolase n=1 Tax=Pseudothioclava arenosa TaxID=1795308 RepID=A0A2A4CN89_9RHOB|nr:serine hydrolase [Pseudothioclava arenosa]PCD75596.1 6-aminohexanoate hydrolase [Pseudothioclava arenosa]
MRLIRFVARALVVLLLLVAGLGLWKREEITRLMAVNALFEPDVIVGNFSNMAGLFHSRLLDRGSAPIAALPRSAPIALPSAARDWIEARAVTGLVVLRDGALVHESYYQGTGPEDLRISWSMAKSVLSALFGTLHADGTIPDLDAQVVDFVPLLKGSAYEGVSIRNLLTMSSGVAFNEDYLDFNSDINRMGRVLAIGGSMDDFAAELVARDAEPGSKMHYVSIDTHVLGMVIAGATGRDPAELMDERIVKRMGLEASPVMLTDSEGTAFVLGGLNLRTRDYARIGQMFLQGGLWQGQQIVPADWVAASTRLQAPGGAGYGYQWWVPRDTADHGNDYFAHGIYGQYIYINPEARSVIAVNAADRGFREPGVDDENLAMLRAIAQAE